MAITAQVNALYARKVLEVNADLAARFKTTAILVAKTVCPNCRTDPATGEGTGIFNGTGAQPFADGNCPVCNNAGVVKTETRRRLIANVRMGRGEGIAELIRPQGVLPQGFAKIKLPVRFQSVLQNADRFEIAGRTTRGTYRRQGEVLTRGLLNEVMAECIVKLDK